MLKKSLSISLVFVLLLNPYLLQASKDLNTPAEHAQASSQSIFDARSLIKALNPKSAFRLVSNEEPPAECKENPNNCESATEAVVDETSIDRTNEATKWWYEEDKKCREADKPGCAGRIPQYTDFLSSKTTWRVKKKNSPASQDSSSSSSRYSSRENSSEEGQTRETQTWQEQYDQLSSAGRLGCNLAKGIALFLLIAGSLELAGLIFSSGSTTLGLKGSIAALIGGLVLNSENSSPGAFHEFLGALALSPLALSYGAFSGAVRTLSFGSLDPSGWGSSKSQRGSRSLYQLYHASRMATQVLATVGGMALGLGTLGVPVPGLTQASSFVGAANAADLGIFAAASFLIQGGRPLYNRAQKALEHTRQSEALKKLDKENNKLKEEESGLAEQLRSLSGGSDENHPNADLPQQNVNTDLDHQENLKEYYTQRIEEFKRRIERQRDINDKMGRCHDLVQEIKEKPEKLKDQAPELQSLRDELKARDKPFLLPDPLPEQLSADPSQIAQEGFLKVDKDGALMTPTLAKGGIEPYLDYLRKHTDDLPVQGKLVSIPHELRSCQGAKCLPSSSVKMHAAHDWAASEGTPVRVTRDSRVVMVGYDKGYGNFVLNQDLIPGKDLMFTLDAHFGREEGTGILVKEGEKLKKHEVIGLVGTSGKSEGPHNHNEVFLVPKYDTEMENIKKHLAILKELVGKNGGGDMETWSSVDKQQYEKSRNEIYRILMNEQTIGKVPISGKEIKVKKYSYTYWLLQKEIEEKKSNNRDGE